MQRESVSIAVFLAITAVAVEFCVSANLLTWIGVAYVTDGGSLLEKIHPGTYLLCAAFASRAITQCRPNAAIWSLCGGDKMLIIYLSCLFGCLIYALLSTGSANTIVLIDTFLPAGLLACVIQDASARELRAMLTVFRSGVILNCCVALGEGLAHTTLVPLYLNDIGYHPVPGEFRPTGFYDHPLTGATMTLMGLALAPPGRWLRSTYLVIAAAALIAFGGRVAVAVACASSMSLSGVQFFGRVLRRDPLTLLWLVYYGASALLCFAIAKLAFEAGVGERLSGHLYWDPSAQIRIAQWSLIGKLNSWQLLFGTTRADLLSLLTPLWLQSGVEVIENFWLLILVTFGAVGFSLFFVGFSMLIAWCWLRTCLRGRILLLSVLIVLSTSNSLGRKSTLLVALVAAICCSEKRRSLPIEKTDEFLVEAPPGNIRWLVR